MTANVLANPGVQSDEHLHSCQRCASPGNLLWLVGQSHQLVTGWGINWRSFWNVSVHAPCIRWFITYLHCTWTHFAMYAYDFSPFTHAQNSWTCYKVWPIICDASLLWRNYHVSFTEKYYNVLAPYVAWWNFKGIPSIWGIKLVMWFLTARYCISQTGRDNFGSQLVTNGKWHMGFWPVQNRKWTVKVHIRLPVTKQ